MQSGIPYKKTKLLVCVPLAHNTEVSFHFLLRREENECAEYELSQVYSPAKVQLFNLTFSSLDNDVPSLLR